MKQNIAHSLGYIAVIVIIFVFGLAQIEASSARYVARVEAASGR